MKIVDRTSAPFPPWHHQAAEAGHLKKIIDMIEEGRPCWKGEFSAELKQKMREIKKISRYL